jgi:hypothetical protein
VSKLRQLSTTKKVLVGFVVAALFFGAVGAMAGPPQEKSSKELEEAPASVKQADTEPEVTADVPKAEVKIVEEAPVAPAQTPTQNNASLPADPPASNCDPNYSGTCVPKDTDVDCYGGDGNGPSFVVGPVTVTGIDIYRLDRDKDNIGCE